MCVPSMEPEHALIRLCCFMSGSGVFFLVQASIKPWGERQCQGDHQYSTTAQWHNAICCLSRFITCFVTVFATVIAITKDMADVEGDRKFGVQTFSTRLGVRNVAYLGAQICVTFLLLLLV